jgi:hypothetical protein
MDGNFNNMAMMGMGGGNNMGGGGGGGGERGGGKKAVHVKVCAMTVCCVMPAIDLCRLLNKLKGHRICHCDCLQIISYMQSEWPMMLSELGHSNLQRSWHRHRTNE